MFDHGLTENLWPARSKPQPDELLSSWIVRLAMAHGLKLHTFCSMAWPKRSIWNRDIDKSADEGLLKVLAEHTGYHIEQIRETTLSAYEGWLYERHNPYGNTLWLMPVGVYHRTRRQFGLQFCPRCLSEDQEPYYRRNWRLAFVTFCEHHSVSLLDRCPKCYEAINFHRDEMGHRSQLTAYSLTRCHSCKFDLRRADASQATEIRGECLILFQEMLMAAMRRGWIEVPSYGAIHSHLYFTVLRQLMRVCATGKQAFTLRDAIRIEFGTGSVAPVFLNKSRDIEHLAVCERRGLLDVARCLLEEWPDRFIHLCHKYKVWSSVLLRDLTLAPFWYWNVIHEHLYRAAYVPSNQEIHSAIAYLNSNAMPLNKKSITRCLGGKNDVFRKRKGFVFTFK